ncbi:hypothetical protein [Enterocloster lavalensis]|uniref:hypothetical protein n=1 Tax=Enterocloster lavalensis TaxID=460384 RepID=UPI0023F25E14|nr:hypothetical protein [Enterocloster lavalensis]
MKKSIFGKIGAAAVVLTLVTSSLVGGTFAKYVTKVTGTATGTVAHWGVKFTDTENNEYTSENAKLTLTGSGEKNTILPGDRGTITINLDGSSADVGFTYTVDITGADTGNTLADKLVFYSDNSYSELKKLDNGHLEGTVEYSENMNRVIEVYWELPASTNADDDAKNAEDTALAGLEAAYDITMKAEQITKK